MGGGQGGSRGGAARAKGLWWQGQVWPEQWRGWGGGMAEAATLLLLGCGPANLVPPGAWSSSGKGVDTPGGSVRQQGPHLPPLSSVSHLSAVPPMGLVPSGSGAPDLLLVTAPRPSPSLRGTGMVQHLSAEGGGPV